MNEGAEKQSRMARLLLGKEAFLVYVLVTLGTIFFVAPREVRVQHLLAMLVREQIVQTINPAREAFNLSPFAMDSLLTEAAQAKADDMVSRGYFSHIGPDGEQPWVWLDAVGYEYTAAGENLAMNFSNSLAVVEAWFQSPPHAAILKNGYFQDIGIGIASGMVDGKEATVVVAFLGRPVPDFRYSSLESVERADVDRIEEAAPEQPVIVQKMQESESGQERLTVLSEEENFVLQSTRVQESLAVSLPFFGRLGFLRVGLLSFFGFLAGWSSYLAVIKKRKSLSALLRIVGLGIFMIALGNV